MTQAQAIALGLFICSGLIFVAGIYTLFGFGWCLMSGSLFLFVLGAFILRGTRE